MEPIRQEQEERSISPLDLVDEFKAMNEGLIDFLWSAYAKPSKENIEAFNSTVETTLRRVNHFHEEELFRHHDEPLLTADTLRTVIDMTEDLLPQVHAINPDCDLSTILEENDREGLLYALLRKDGDGEEQEECSDEDDEDDERDKIKSDFAWFSQSEASEFVCNYYKDILSDLRDAFMDSDPIDEFYSQGEERSKKKTFALAFGAMIVASFVGSKLANK
jgi:hypothetical protein